MEQYGNLNQTINNNSMNFCNSNFIDNLLMQLNNLLKTMDIIKKEYKILQDYMDKTILHTGKNKKFNDSIDNYINSANEIKKTRNQNEVEELKKKVTDGIKKIFDNFSIKDGKNHIKNISNSIEQLNNILEDINECFDPTVSSNKNNDKRNNPGSETTKSNTSSNSIVDYISETLYDKDKDLSNFYDKTNTFIININEEEKSPFKCKECKKNIAFYYCKHCIDYFCENCYINNNDDEALINHIFVLMDDNKIEKEEKKNAFLKSFIYFLKNYILKCNRILNNENQTYTDPDNYEAFQYPIIQNNNNLDDMNIQIEFLMDINKVYELIIKKLDVNNDEYEDRKELCSILSTS